MNAPQRNIEGRLNVHSFWSRKLDAVRDLRELPLYQGLFAGLFVALILKFADK